MMAWKDPRVVDFHIGGQGAYIGQQLAPKVFVSGPP
jgi:hypothetical protein